jgi:hypothetical protein
MAEDDSRKMLCDETVRLFRRFQMDGDLAPFSDRQEWENLVESKRPGERDLLQELANFADLWRYFRERGEKLGIGIVDAVSNLPQLPIRERTARLKDVNRRLMERVSDACERPKLRN